MVSRVFLWMVFLVASAVALRINPRVQVTSRFAKRIQGQSPSRSLGRGSFLAMSAAESTSPLAFLSKNDNLSLPPAVQSLNKFTIEAVKSVLVWCYGDRHYARFAALETIARVPYFSYTSVLHLYETMGWFRKKEYIQMHFAESWNELHHLLIMEELGGNSLFMDRFIAQYIAFFYYWLVVLLYMTFPAVAYDLNKHVETHAYETYDNFLKENEQWLKQLPPAKAAVEYYEAPNSFLYDAFQCENVNHNHHVAMDTLADPKTIIQERREQQRKLECLYDVFERVRDDEAVHAKTMYILQRDVTLNQKNGGRGLFF